MTDRTHPDSGRTTGGIVEMLQDRVAELEAQLDAIGAGGVSGPLMGQPQAPLGGRWYMVTHDGAATLCIDEEDAQAEAVQADRNWPRMGPHRVVKLVEASEAGFTAADMATAEARGFRDGAASARQPAPTPQADSQPVLDNLALMKVVMRADEALAGRCTRGTTNWAAAIGKAVQDAVLAARAPADSGAAPAGGEIDRLRAALVYVAYALHDTPKYMLAEGITLIDGDTVRVSRDGWTVEASVNPARAAPPAQAADSVLEDAARYRWLRNKSTVLHNTAWLGGATAVQRDVDFLRRDDALAALDAAIDAARKQGANHD